MTSRINPIDGAEMVYVPEGEFHMGLSSSEADEFRSRTGTDPSSLQIMRPQRTVFLDSFWIYRTPITYGQYRKYCDAIRECEMPRNVVSRGKQRDIVMDDSYPVVFVTWSDAKNYCRWAKAHLPTEAQWEKAARGTTNKFYPWGDQWDNRKANFRVKEAEGPVPVEAFADGQSPYGALQMSGNVKEWCCDKFAPYGYDRTPFRSIFEYWKFQREKGIQDNAYVPIRNPRGPRSGSDRVVRGGGWGNANGYWAGLACYRGSWDPNNKSCDIGFRPVVRFEPDHV